MGFLLGAFGKLMAGRRVRDLQARMMRVQSKARRTTRQIEKMSKMLETQKKMEINNLAMQQQAGNLSIPFMISATIGNCPGANGAQIQQMMMGGGDINSILQSVPKTDGSTATDNAAQQAWMAQFSQLKTQMSSRNEMVLTQMKNQIEEKYENMNDIMLEPLKMEEDSLQTEKDSLESQIQIAQADYEACKKMEQADAKNLAPNYTGQG